MRVYAQRTKFYLYLLISLSWTHEKNDNVSKYNKLMNELKILMNHFFPWLIYARLICFYIDTHRLIFISNKNQSESHCKSIWARKFDMIVISAPPPPITTSAMTCLWWWSKSHREFLHSLKQHPHKSFVTNTHIRTRVCWHITAINSTNLLILLFSSCFPFHWIFHVVHGMHSTIHKAMPLCWSREHESQN